MCLYVLYIFSFISLKATTELRFYNKLLFSVIITSAVLYIIAINLLQIIYLKLANKLISLHLPGHFIDYTPSVDFIIQLLYYRAELHVSPTNIQECYTYHVTCVNNALLSSNSYWCDSVYVYLRSYTIVTGGYFTSLKLHVIAAVLCWFLVSQKVV